MFESIRSQMTERLTSHLGWANLQAMAQVLNWVPSMRHHLRDRHPVGKPFVFKAGFCFLTANGQNAVHIRFDHGRAKVGFGPLPDADVTVRFKRAEHMRVFFINPANVFDMLLDNDVTFSGNLACLAKFGHMSEAVKALGRKRARAKNDRLPGPLDWRDLPAPPAGEACRDRPEGELTHLDDPYLAGYSLTDFPRIQRLLWAFRTEPPTMCAERARLVTEYKLTHNGSNSSSPVLKQAKSLAYLLRNKRAIVYGDDILAGTTTSKRIGVVMYPEASAFTMWSELLTMETRELNPYRITDEDVEVLGRQVLPFWLDDNVREWTRARFDHPLEISLEERWVLYFLWKHTAVSHTIADFPRVLAEGLVPTMAQARARAEKSDAGSKRDFYLALAEAVSGVLDYSARMAAEARRQAGRLQPTDSRRAELLTMAQVCDRVPAGPCQSLHEAVQVIWLVFLCMHQESTNTGLSVGRLDAWLQPYLDMDLEGVSDPKERVRIIERAIELTCALMLKMTDHLPMVPDMANRLFGGSSSNQVITLGGQSSEGETAVCDMTWIFLKATEMLRLRDPNLNARFTPGVNSEAYLRRLCEVNLLTRATPALHNDAAVVPALIHEGFSEADARDWCATGCVEPTSSGRHFGHTNCMMLNLVAPLEMVLRDGRHPLLGQRVGPRTGDPANFSSYQEFFAAYLSQLGWLIDRAVGGNNMFGRANQVLRPTPLLSALFDGPMDSGLDVIDGGARYNTSGVALIGLSDVVDSLASIKLLIYGSKQVDFDGLLTALDADFEGHEALLATIRNKVPKFGQNQPLTDSIADELMAFSYKHFKKQEHYRGGKYLTGYWTMSNHVAFGKLSGALPSGRKRGKSFSPGLTPAPGCGADLTEQITCVANLDALKMPNNIAFNVKLVPAAGDDHQQVLDRMSAYVGAYFDMGGMQMQFNVVSTETLRSALAHPDQYRDLLVRISGYNAYFVELNRDMQVELIERMEHKLGGG